MPRFSDCWRCGTRNTSIACSRCQSAKYCSDECRRNDRARHKVECDGAVATKTCTACGKTAENLKMCSSCCHAFYCDINCQRQDWPKHRKPCKAVDGEMKLMSCDIMMSFALPRMPMVCGAQFEDLYYWNDMPAFDCLNLDENEGAGCAKDFYILFCTVMDLGNMALTCASLPDGFENRVKFTLNDTETCILARLVLLIYMLIKGACGIEEQVVELWYSTKLSKETYRSLRMFLQELIELSGKKNGLQSSTRGLLFIHDDHLKELRSVWKMWLGLPVTKTTWIQEERKKAMDQEVGGAFGTTAYYKAIPPNHVSSVKKWMKNGHFAKPGTPFVGENPTLTGRPVREKAIPYSFCSPPGVFPFTGWDYLEVKNFKVCDSLVEMYRSYVEDVLKRFQEKISTGCISFQVILGNCMEINRFLDPAAKYDRILTSNLCDYLPFPELLKLCSGKLNHDNDYAVVVTVIGNWTFNHCPNGNVAGLHPKAMEALIWTALEDTNNPVQILEGISTSIIEYYDNSGMFLEYLRALFFAFGPPGQPSKFPSPKTFGNEFGLELRDYLRNENRLSFFKLAVNRRRPTMISGLERTLEWIPLKK